MNPEMVGKRIAALRKQMGLTQKDLACKLHITDKAISKWERGLNFPELTLMEPLAAALDTTVIHLLALEDATNLEVANKVCVISAQEKENLLCELRKRSWINICIEAFLIGALYYVSYLINSYGVGGVVHGLTAGLTGFVGTLIGSELYFLKNVRRLK